MLHSFGHLKFVYVMTKRNNADLGTKELSVAETKLHALTMLQGGGSVNGTLRLFEVFNVRLMKEFLRESKVKQSLMTIVRSKWSRK